MRRPQPRNPPKLTPQPHPSTGPIGTQKKIGSSRLRVLRPKLDMRRVCGKLDTSKVVKNESEFPRTSSFRSY